MFLIVVSMRYFIREVFGVVGWCWNIDFQVTCEGMVVVWVEFIDRVVKVVEKAWRVRWRRLLSLELAFRWRETTLFELAK